MSRLRPPAGDRATGHWRPGTDADLVLQRVSTAGLPGTKGDDRTHAPAEESQPTAPSIHELDHCVVAVLDSPTAVASVLDVLRRALRDGVLDRLEFIEVQAALLALHDK